MGSKHQYVEHAHNQNTDIDLKDNERYQKESIELNRLLRNQEEEFVSANHESYKDGRYLYATVESPYESWSEERIIHYTLTIRGIKPCRNFSNLGNKWTGSSFMEDDNMRQRNNDDKAHCSSDKT